MKFHSMRSALAVFATFSAAILLTACGGGGAGGNPNQGGPISISPQNGTFYAGVPSRLTLQGGRKPYSLTSSEPGVLPVPAIVDANFVDVIPNNPGIVDPNLQPGELPRRTVIVSMRDTTGILVNANIVVGQNFLTGYGLTLSPTTCPSVTGSTTVVTACPGGRTAARMSAVFNGSLTGDREFRYQVISGNFTVGDPVTGISGLTVLLHSDHVGTVLGFIDVPVNSLGGLGVIRVIDVATGVYADQVFIIGGQGTGPGRPIILIPSAISFTGSLTTRCGVGSADVLAFDGTPPYTAVSTDPSVLVTPALPANSPTQPGKFTIVAFKDAPPCLTGASVVISDSAGQRATLTVTTLAGTTALPTLAVSPGTITLACGATGAVSVIGGTGSYSVNSSNANVTAVTAGNTLSITRSNAGGLLGVPGGSSTVSVTDGGSIVNVTVTSPATCP